LTDMTNQAIAWARGDAEPAVRAAAATALGQIGLKTAGPALTRAVQDPQAEVVFAAAAGCCGWDAAAYRVDYAAPHRRAQERRAPPRIAAEAPEGSKRAGADGFEQGIGFIPFGGIGLQVFKSFRQDNVSPVRAAAAQRLAADPDPASGRALVRATTDEKWIVRASAVSAIATRGDRSLGSALVPRLDDENETVRFNAAAALVGLETGNVRK
jgi:HEAT repeat protein